MDKIKLKGKIVEIDLKLTLKKGVDGVENIEYKRIEEDFEPELFNGIIQAVECSLQKGIDDIPKCSCEYKDTFSINSKRLNPNCPLCNSEELLQKQELMDLKLSKDAIEVIYAEKKKLLENTSDTQAR